METPRENLLKIFRRQGISQAGYEFVLSPAMIDKVENKFQRRDYVELFDFGIRSSGVEVYRQNFTDWKNRYFPNESFREGTTFDIWGVGHEPAPEAMHMTRMLSPMKNFTTREEFEAYPYPEINQENFNALQSAIKNLHDQGYFVCENMQCTIWEKAWYMRSMEEMMVGMLTDDENVAYHLDRITDLAVELAEMYARADADLIFLGDDIGMQHTIMMSSDIYQTWLKPRLAKVIAAARKIKKDVLIAYHSCGYIEPLIEDLIEAGIDVLNPVQPECMDFAEIHEKYGNRLSFWGTLGTQQLFPFGTAEEVYAKTIENLTLAGAKGGLLATPTHMVEPEVPLENILAYLKACKDFVPPVQL